MAVYVTGDLHAGNDIQSLYDWYRGYGRSLGRDDYLIVAGDFGYPWDGSPCEEDEVFWLETRPGHVLFVDGNHERYDWWGRRPVEEWHGGITQRLRRHSPVRRLCRGEGFYLGGEKVLTPGGATSVDRGWRTAGVEWWPEELPSGEELEHARATLDACGWRVDYVVTHTCSTRMLGPTLRPDPGWESPDADRLTDFLDELEDRLEFRHWYYGHFHRDMDVDERHTVLFDSVVLAGGEGW